jgi:hypothetical protein
LGVEKAIHVVTFLFLLIGLCGMSAWAAVTYVDNDLLKGATIVLSWGVILLALYLGFRTLDWDWWS